MAGELQLLVLKGTGRAPTLLLFMPTQRTGSYQKNTPHSLRFQWHRRIKEGHSEVRLGAWKSSVNLQWFPDYAGRVLNALSGSITPNLQCTCIPQHVECLWMCSEVSYPDTE